MATMVNEIRDITVTIGFIGGFKGTRKQLDAQIKRINAEGWEIHQYIKGARASFGTAIKQMLTLVFTLGFYSKATVATVLCKKDR